MIKLPNTKRQTLNTSNHKRGLTMIELLIVIAILAILMLILLWSLRGQTYKARDAKRKADIDAYEKIFEDYFNDKTHYPSLGSLDDCNSADLSPYVKKILCDPGPANEPYFYWVDDDETAYAICADLENDNDPDIVQMGCGSGCGAGGEYDYCMVVGGGIDLVGGDFDGGGGTGDPGVYQYACVAGGVCNDVGLPNNCDYTFASNVCNNLCGISTYTCDHPH
jgi:prepilin-type N-terminal cleavage/methylation domain-containing protein